ncbi:kinesin-associated protein 3 [Folsomia candida]|uniref:Kinesin-associated protein 3 n=1 Tax=Folsomia candida TaxID=158441 RepID=A0A226DYR9_FOLCA|nr:kinesin-associated protein 3 [Folsomia candida]OXA50433.1 Kinesin-associated protein 3 [Folsomia candida]
MNYESNKPSKADEAEVVTRTFNIHRFDPHPRRKILIIHGEVLITISNPLCPVVLAEESREFKKLISLENLFPTTPREQVIDSVLRECPFINPDMRLHLAVTIDFLKNRQYDDNGMVITPSTSLTEREKYSSGNNAKVNQSTASTPTGDFPDFEVDTISASQQGTFSTSANTEAELNEKVDMTRLDTYVELLYEDDLSEKARGARCIAKLAKISENLAVIAYHETALNALFRTLREEYRKSLDLTTHIMSTCLSYAQFTDFHPILLTNKTCSITFDLIEFELQRYEKWRLEVARRQDIVENRSEFPGSAGSFQKAKADFERMRVKFAEVTRKQDHILALAFEVILYLAENHGLQGEILSRGVVPMLMDTLSRKNIDLLKVGLKYLKDLSYYLPCKVQMGQLYITEKIAQLLDANIPNEIIRCCLDLLFNLSFDTKLRHKMVMFGILPKLAFYLEDTVLENVTRKLLYVMSMDRRVRPRIASLPQILPVLIQTLNENREEPARNSLDVAGILINLATNKKCALAMCDKTTAGNGNNNLVTFLQQSFESEDEIVMKIVRNLSAHSNTKEAFAPFICDLARAILDATSEEFVLECIGTLANLDLPNIDFSKLLQEFQLIPWIQAIFDKFLSTNLNLNRTKSASSSRTNANNNNSNSNTTNHTSLLTLEVVILTGTCCSDYECADLLIQEGILDQLIKILITTSDLGLKSQVLYVFYKMCSHSGTKQHIQERTQIPKIVLELLQHENLEVQQLCEGIMNQFGETDEAWMEKLREKRFRFFNEAWIEMTERSVDDDDPYGFTYGNTREKIVIDMGPSSTSETLMTEDDSGEEHSDLEVDKDDEQLLQERGGRIRGENNTDKAGSSIFDRFKAQYEREMRAKEQWDRREFSDEEDDEEINNGELTLVKNRAKSARRIKK